INAVLGLDEMILRESGEKQIRSYASDIQSSGKMLLSVINDILDFSKIESGKMEIVPGDYDLSCMVSDLVNMISSRAQAKGLDFVVQVQEDCPHLLYGDDIRIKQCILNILTNAVKYTPEGSVTLSIYHERLDEGRCYLCVSVKDTGIGIKEEDIKKLFSPFERIEEGRNKAIEGTGLGMSIVKSLLSAMGSQLDVKSVYGKGSDFSFRVVQNVSDWDPIGSWEESKAKSLERAGSYTESFQAPEARILVVDDTPVNLTVMQGLLKQTRIQIDTAVDGLDGLEKAKAAKYDVIFIDHRMPRMDGMEMIAALRADSSCLNAGTVCIALTANTVGDVKSLYIDSGFEDYLSKPVEPRRLEELLSRCLPPSLVLHEGDEGWQAGREEPGESDADCDMGGIDRMVREETDSYFRRSFGLDISAAMMNCGTADVFADVVKVFHESIADKADSIEKYAGDGDWQNYTILVHSLKSSARLIGAGDLSTMAADLEALGNKARANQEDADAVACIRKDTVSLLADYRAYIDKLAPLVGNRAVLETELSEQVE
ncbi:MAG: response regulator, partial [Treponema sp.]|nr:response regulator [Treponema sp.]